MTRLLAFSLLVLALAAAGSGLLGVVGGDASEASPAQARGPLGSGKKVVFAFGGDVHFEGALSQRLATSASSLLGPIKPVLASADLAVVNLETAVTNTGFAATKEFVFRAPPSAYAALRGGSVDVASLANNHGMDYGEQGLRDSLAAARRYRFPVVGAGLDAKRAYAPYRATVNGQRIAVLGATQVLDDHLISAWTAGPGKPGLASAKDVPRLVEEVRRARRSSDTVVVFLHWGVEAERCPSSRQRQLALALVAGRRRHRRRRARTPAAGRRDDGRRSRRLRPRELRLVRDDRDVDAHRRAARDGHRAQDRRVPVGARAHRRRRPAPTHGHGAAKRAR